ncbi:MAG TPA: hypothetical protein VF753_16630 [Terriglobales bacterium]
MPQETALTPRKGKKLTLGWIIFYRNREFTSAPSTCKLRENLQVVDLVDVLFAAAEPLRLAVRLLHQKTNARRVEVKNPRRERHGDPKEIFDWQEHSEEGQPGDAGSQ